MRTRKSSFASVAVVLGGAQRRGPGLGLPVKAAGFCIVAVLCGIAAACGGSGSKAAGDVGGPCYSNGTCNAGLGCYSNICVSDNPDASEDGTSAASSSSGSSPAAEGGTCPTPRGVPFNCNCDAVTRRPVDCSNCPPGTYCSSCNYCSFNSAGVLTCGCSGDVGGAASSINLNLNPCLDDITNCKGVLTCGACGSSGSSGSGCTSNSDCSGCARCELSTGKCVSCPVGAAGVCTC
jgi:hypothetical protein